MRNFKSTLLFSFLILPTLILAQNIYAQDNNYQERTYVLEAKRPLTNAEMNQLRIDMHADSFDRLSPYSSSYFNRVYRLTTKVQLTEGRSAHPLVLKIEAPTTVDAMSTTDSETDPLAKYQWAVKNIGQVVDYDIDDITIGQRQGLKDFDIELPKQELTLQRPVRIAVIDYGVDLQHPDLQKSIDINEVECVNGEIPLNATEDKDGNGYKGDCKGWNFTGKEKEGTARQIDDSGHGTHVAGIMAAERHNDVGIQGVSNQIRILPLKVLSLENERKNAQGFTDRIAQAVLYAVTRKVDVINLSLGWPLFMDKQHVREALLEAERQGVLIVAAAGNNSHSAPILPCAMPSVLCVGSVNNDGAVSDFSNYGAHVDVLAPGDHILSTIPTAVHSKAFSVVGYDYKDGTSQAAPYVSALAAILKSRDALSNNEVRSRIIRTSKPLNKNDKKFFRAGVISFQSALANQQNYNLTLNLKEKERYILWKGSTSKANWEIPLQNHSDRDLEAEIRVQPVNSSAVRIKHADKVLVPAQGRVLLKVDIEILDTKRESEIVLSIQVSTSVQKTLHHAHLQLLRDLQDDPALLKFELPPATGFNLFSLKTFGWMPKQPIYYEFKTTTEMTQFRVIEMLASQKAVLKTVHQLPNVERPLLVRTLDVNGDKSPDLQVVALVKMGDDKKIVYYNLSLQNNSPVFKEHEQWNSIELELEGALEVEAALQHLTVQVDEQSYLTPFFFGFGPLPKRDQPKDNFSPRVTADGQYIYYFIPEKLEAGWKLTARAINSPDRVKKWKKDLKLKAFYDIRFLHMLPAENDNTLRVLTSIGYDYNRETYIAHLKMQSADNIEVTWEHIKNDSVVDGYALDQTISLDDGESEPTLVGQVNDRLWVLSRAMNGVYNQQKLTPLDRSEIFNSYLKSYRKNNLFFSFMQTVSEILLITFDGNREMKDSTPFHVSSFLPGQLYQERSYPIWFGRENKYPALYVDSTQIVARTASLIVASDEGKLSTPMKMSVQIPDRCIANNPSLWDNAEYRFSLLCQVSQTGTGPNGQPLPPRFEMWFLPMK